MSSDAKPRIIGWSPDILSRVEKITFELSVASPQSPPSGFRLGGLTAEIDLMGVTLGQGETAVVCLPLAEGEEEWDIYHYNEESGEWDPPLLTCFLARYSRAPA